MAAQLLSVMDTQNLLQQGYRLIDIRPADEYLREHIVGAENIALDQLSQRDLTDGKVVFCCLSGMRTKANSDALATWVGDTPLVLDGGLNAWKKANGATVADASQPLPLMRQVQIGAGILILLSVLLAVLVDSAFLYVTAFVGAGLTFAGLTGWCGMALLLMKMPWNKQNRHHGRSCQL